MDQIPQVLGALFILAAFILSQAGRLDVQSRAYLLLNAAGGTILAADAYLGDEPGFLLLEGIWALIAAVGLLRSLIGGRAPGRRPA